MNSVLVTGASRGIGLALVEQFVRSGDQVIAACRSPEDAAQLQALAAAAPEAVRIEQMDVTDAASVKSLAARLGGMSIDILINNAGILGGPRQALEDIDYDAWRATLETNLLAPFRVSQALLPNLARSASPRLVVISSELGSSAWPHGGLYIYASSKGGLNRVVKIMSIDLRDKGVCVIAMHPGLVKTDMAGDLGVITAEESASGIASVTRGLTLADSGSFLQWNGTHHAW